jgi:hypothetical protein
MLFIAVDFTQLPFRFYYIGLDFIVIYLAFQLAGRFLYDGLSHRKDLGGQLNYALAITFAFIGVNFVLKLLHLFFYRQFTAYQQVVFILVAAGALFAITAIEKSFRKNRIFTIISLINLILFIIIPPDTSWIFIPILLSAIIMIFPIQVIIRLYRLTGGTIRFRVFLLILSILVLYIGIALNMEENQIYITSELILIIGLIFISIGLLGVYFSFMNVNVIIESDWQDALEDLYVIDKETMVPLYYQNISKHMEYSDKNQMSFFSGGIIGVDSLIKSISDSKSDKGIFLIEQKDHFLMIEQGNDVVVCFLCSENLRTLRFFIRKVRDMWDTVYGPQKIDWVNYNDALARSAKKSVEKVLRLSERFK